MRKVHWAALAAVLVVGAAARASAPVGVFALIDKVVTEPREGPAERVQVWGVFGLVQVKNDRLKYPPPERGYLYYAVVPGKEAVCRREWADLARAAGKGQILAFGSHEIKNGRVRPAREEAKAPDPHPVANGVFRINYVTKNILDIRTLPKPTAPADGANVPAGKATLRVANLDGEEVKGARYVFEIEDPTGARETSPALDPGEGLETKWTPNLAVKAGDKYVWRVWAVTRNFKGPVASSTFKGLATP